MFPRASRPPSPERFRADWRALAWLVALLCAPAAAAHDDLMAQLQDFLHRELAHLGDEVHTEITAPAPQALSCVEPAPFLAPGAEPLRGRVVVGIRCGAGTGKVFYVPAQVRIVGQYLVAARDLGRGERVSDDAVRMARGDLTALNGTALTNIAPGMVARQRLATDTPLQARHLQREQLVRRGDQVVIENRGRGFMVTRQGEALAAGALGDSIAVRLDRHQQVKGTISGSGRVIALP